MTKSLLYLFLVGQSFSTYAQFNETIRTGRPGKSIGAFTVGHRIFQVQSGVDYFNYKNTSIDLSGSGFLSNTVVRFGLTESFEISALLEYKTTDEKIADTTETLNGWSAIDLGMRYHIYTGEGLTPNIGFQIRWRIPRVGGDYEIDQWAPRFIVVTSQ